MTDSKKQLLVHRSRWIITLGWGLSFMILVPLVHYGFVRPDVVPSDSIRFVALIGILIPYFIITMIIFWSTLKLRGLNTALNVLFFLLLFPPFGMYWFQNRVLVADKVGHGGESVP